MFGIQNQRNGGTAKLPSPSRWRWITSLLLVAIGGIVGFILGRFGPVWKDLKYSATWDIADVLSWVATIAIALYVQHSVASGSEAERERRRYLTELARRVPVEWERLHALLRGPEVANINAVAAAIKTVDVALAELRDALKICRVTATSAHIENEWRAYRRTLQNFPEPITMAEQIILQQHFAGGRRQANWLVLALPAS